MAESGAAAAEAPPAAQQQPAQPEPASLPLRPPQPPQQPAAAAADSGKRPELCRHWGRTGSCLHSNRCRFAHPAGIAPLAAPRRRTWGGTRAAVRNRSKATVLRRHVIDAFGREALAGGSGIVDVAGGKGEISFQFVNLNGIPSTVLDPRPLRLKQFERRANLGFFHNTGPYADYTDTPLDLLRGAGTQPPAHARMFLEPPLVAALARLAAARAAAADAAAAAAAGKQGQESSRHAAAADISSSSGDGGSGGDGGGGGSSFPHASDPAVAACLRAARRLLAASCRRAAAVEWTTNGLQDHEPEAPAAAAATAQAAEELESAEAAGADEVAAAVAAAAAAVPAAAAAAAVDEVAAGEAAAADKQAAAGAEAHTEAAATAQADSAASGKAAAEAEAELAVLDLAAGGDRSDSDSGSSSGDDLTADDPPPPELDALLLTLLDCSCVLGMHPDAATEPAVALALALNKPFAVVPCCLCSQQFPKRRRADGGPVGSTAELISYICEIAAAAGRVAHVVELPFEGKNVLVYSHSTHERGPDSS